MSIDWVALEKSAEPKVWAGLPADVKAFLAGVGWRVGAAQKVGHVGGDGDGRRHQDQSERRKSGAQTAAVAKWPVHNRRCLTASA